MENSDAGENEFVDNTLELEDIPQIELPFRDDLSDNLKNLLRALIINQQNIISNTSFLFNRLKEISSILKRLAPDAPENPPNSPVLPPITEEA